jgi:UPF0716 protein FxsA
VRKARGVSRLLLLFVLLPAVELMLLIEIGSRIGTLRTIALIVLTGIVGASLARSQGLGVIRALQRETSEGRMPAVPLIDGALILVAAALLVTPGVLTDVFGFACLVPVFRSGLRGMLLRRLERAVREGTVHVYSSGGGGGREEKVVHDLRDPRND